MKFFIRPAARFSRLWPQREQLKALTTAAAGQPEAVHAMVRDFDRFPENFPADTRKKRAYAAEYVGLWRREAFKLEESGRVLEATSLRIERGLVRL